MEIAFSEKISPQLSAALLSPPLMNLEKREGFQAAICRRVIAGK